MACHGRGRAVEALLEAARGSIRGKLRSEILHEPFDVRLAEKCGNFADSHRALAEAFEHQAKLGKLVCAPDEQFGAVRSERDDLRNEQALRRDAAIRERGLELLVNK